MSGVVGMGWGVAVVCVEAKGVGGGLGVAVLGLYRGVGGSVLGWMVKRPQDMLEGDCS